jgi:hypothetical protein
MGVIDIISRLNKDMWGEVARKINGGEIPLSDRAKAYINEKQAFGDMNTNPIIQALEEQFGKNSAKLLTIENYDKLKGLRFGGEYTVHSAHESIGNYTFMVQSSTQPVSLNNAYLFRLRRVPEVKDLKLYRLTLDNKAFVTLPRKIIESPSLLMKEMYELILAEATPLPF